MFDAVERVSGDAILGLIQAYNNDDNPNKVDLGVGVYRDKNGRTPVLESVKRAEKQRLDTETTKAYIGSHGDPDYGRRVLRLVLGEDSPVIAAGRASATQAPGGTGALRLAGDFIKKQFANSRVWLPQPSWPNHVCVFAACGLDVARYPYVDGDNRFDFDGMLAALKTAPAGDVVLLHACCHNPSGFDPSPEQWRAIAEVVRERSLLALVDFAYQGFGDGLNEDAFSVRLLAQSLDEMLITQSCSKNFGIYRERTGCLIAIAKDKTPAQNVHSQLAVVARGNYSTPPAHGSTIVSTILGSAELSALWQREVAAMRSRINDLRRDFVAALAPYGLDAQFNHIGRQRGMFSYTGLTREQVRRLREAYSIYMVTSGRANVAGLSSGNLDYVCRAINDVVTGDTAGNGSSERATG